MADKVKKAVLSVRIDPEVLEKTRNAVYWIRTTMDKYVENALLELLKGIENNLEEPIPERHEQLKPGRKLLPKNSKSFID